MSIDMKMVGEVRRQTPEIYGDAHEAEVRQEKTGGIYVQPIMQTKHILADEGKYFVAMTTNGGTGVICGTNTVANVETTGNLVYIKNNAASGEVSSTRMYLDYIRIIVNTIGTGGTAMQCYGRLDNHPTKYTSGGTVLFPVSPNMDSSAQSNGYIVVGNLVTLAATTSSRMVHRNVMKQAAQVIGDEYIIKYGGVDISDSALAGGSTPSRFCIPAAPVCIGPQQCYTLNVWNMAHTSGPAYEIEIGYWER